MQDFSDRLSYETPIQPKRKRGALAILLSIGGGFALLACGGCFGFLMYVGAAGPETSIYTREEIPNSYVKIARDVGGLEMDETMEYFYSDGLVDIKDGFYYASDRKVVVYLDDNPDPLTTIPYDEITSIDFSRDTSFLNDSQITIVAGDQYVIFPVSSEKDLDLEFHRYITNRSPNLQ